ncbi:MAG: M28 family peptidase [Clostridia bacterium]|nr:M28 family peptidase [Clostridia bacterium]
MKEETRKYAREAFEIVEHAAYGIGSRLPGTENEKKFGAYMGEKLREIGIKPIREEFGVSPRSSIGGLPYTGYICIAMSALSYLALAIPQIWYGMTFFYIAATVWLICSVFLYKTWFDMFFHQEISQNTYGVLEPEDGKFDYTIILSAHTDTCWTWKHSEHSFLFRNSKPLIGLLEIYIKVGYGAVCYFLLLFICIFMSVLHLSAELNAAWALSALESEWFSVFTFIMYLVPALTALGGAFLAMWNDKNPQNASKGAMDNATGVALGYEVIKYFKENPDKMPKNCRIVDLNTGCEEVGLRGAMAFAREHKNDGLLDNAWNINIDSIADDEYFEVVIKDDWMFTRFDKDLERMFKETFAEMGIVSKTGGCIHNPVGGSDSTPMKRAGVKTVTFAAQNPMPTWYYHTWHDVPERFSEETVGKGFEVILRVIEKISEQEENER